MVLRPCGGAIDLYKCFGWPGLKKIGVKISEVLKLDKLRTSYGLETPICERISKKSQEQMERWFEDAILKELVVNPMTLAELLERFRCGKEILLPSLTELEISGRIEQIKSKFAIKCVEDSPG